MTDRGTGTDGRLTFEAARVRDVMNDDVVTCSPDMPVRAVAALMAENRIHSVVVDNGGAEGSWGIVSDLDLVAGAAGDLDREQASDVAGTPVVTVTPDHSVVDAARLMAEYQTTHLISVDPESGRPVGVISSLDIARTFAQV